MKKLLAILSCGFGCHLLSLINAYGQQATDSLAIEQIALDNTIAFFNQSAGSQKRLYNGSVYEEYKYSFLNGHPFFKSSESGNGTVFYDGILYTNVPLRYDLLKDKLVLEHYDESSQLSLIREKIAYFTLHNHTFVYLTPDSLVNTPLTAGFYDQLQQGQVSLLAKRNTRVEQKTVPGGVERRLQPKVRYFLKQNQQYYAVKSQSALLKILKEKKKELQLYVKQNNLRYGNNLEDGLVKIIAYYNSLKP
ncbi:MAG: hypothetical protein ACO1OF_17600 [Adhaeribacter sp.]